MGRENIELEKRFSYFELATFRAKSDTLTKERVGTLIVSAP